jgi:hypothetical protein
MKLFQSTLMLITTEGIPASRTQPVRCGLHTPNSSRFRPGCGRHAQRLGGPAPCLLATQSWP